ncbi:MAG: DUF4416 family protein [Proteobacteria bacterium]|nr:DUF4416 family protein [Pseudomonadota bacterium]
MSFLKDPQQVKLFFSVFSSDKELIENVIKELESKYGLVDMSSEYMPFNQTDYYEPEFGKELVRKIVFFENLISPEKIVDIKLEAMILEEKNRVLEKRRVNIDPGYVALSRVVLSTGKDYTHRIYLSKGVYADLTYIYKKNIGYVCLPWTYPDYATDKFRNIFLKAREVLKKQLRVFKND